MATTETGTGRVPMKPARPVTVRSRATGAARRSTVPAKTGRGRAGRIVVMLLILGLSGWAGTATWLTFKHGLTIQRLQDEEADLSQQLRAKQRALGLALVGTGVGQGVAERLADIYARQVQLEDRQSTLLHMAERLMGPVSVLPTTSPATAAPTAPPPPPGQPLPPARATESSPRPSGPASGGAGPVLRLGGQPAADPAADRPPGPRSALDGPSDPSAAGHRRGLPGNLASLSIGEQLPMLEKSIDRLQSGQTRLIEAYSTGLRSAVKLIKDAITEVGLQARADGEENRGPPAATPPRAGQKADPFDGQVVALESEFRDVQRWRAAVDKVPFRAPLPEGDAISSSYGTRKDPFTGAAKFHAGLDFRSPTGTPVRSSAAGRVITAGVTGGYGNLVEIEHDTGIVTRYGHLSAFQVSVGDVVQPGIVVGLVGSTGRSTGPHLHYETRLSGTAVNPGTFIKAGSVLFGRFAEAAQTPAKASEEADEATDD